MLKSLSIFIEIWWEKFDENVLIKILFDKNLIKIW